MPEYKIAISCDGELVYRRSIYIPSDRWLGMDAEAMSMLHEGLGRTAESLAKLSTGMRDKPKE